jgi:hypothetical protein
MNTTKNSIALEFLSTFLPENSIALKVNPDKTAGNNRSNYSLLLAKIFTFCLLGMVLFSACKKELDVLPSASTANLNDTILKAGLPTYYIALTGNDATGNGTYAKPWASLYKASQMVTTSGNIIHIAAGTYTESHVCSIAVGVSIVGEGATTIIHGTYRTTGSNNLTGATISLVSPNQGTNGNQSISYLTLDGNSLAGSRAISVKNRGHVLVHHLIVKDFFLGGVMFYSSGAWSSSPPAVYEVGNQLYNCTIDNCGDESGTWNGDGCILIACQQDLLIHDNLLYNNKRTSQHNGHIVNGGGRYFKGVKYYNNQSWKPDVTSGWNFHVEIYDNQGGFEVYNNIFTGGFVSVDMAGFTSSVGTYDYSWSIHDNIFQQNNPSYEYADGDYLLLENHFVKKTLIYNNTFNDGYCSVRLIPWVGKDVFVYDNTFNSVTHIFRGGYSVQGASEGGTPSFDNVNIYRNKYYSALPKGVSKYGAFRFQATNRMNFSNINIYNNTMVTNNLFYQPAVEFSVGSGSTIKGVNIKNNIFSYFKNGGPLKVANSGTFNGLHIENNLSYNTDNYNILPLLTGNSISNYTYANNIPKSNTTQVSPRFVNEATHDFHLQAGSPAINAGVNVGLPFYGSAPDISTYEYKN